MGEKRRGRTAIQVVSLVAILGSIGGVVLWQWMHANSPVTTVDRAGQAIKSGDWKTVYRLINWSEDQKRMLDEDRFATLANIYNKVYALQDYKVGAPAIEGETATVPVTVTAKISSLISASTKIDNADVRCRKVQGEWRIEPDLKNGLLGLGHIGIGGL